MPRYCYLERKFDLKEYLHTQNCLNINNNTLNVLNNRTKNANLADCIHIDSQEHTTLACVSPLTGQLSINLHFSPLQFLHLENKIPLTTKFRTLFQYEIRNWIKDGLINSDFKQMM